MASSVDCVLLLVAALLGSYHAAVEGGCASKCCRGSDNSCTTTDWRADRVYGTCYCDEVCVRTLDCCHDYPTACPAQACLVTQWSHWSGCAQSCQPSKRVRRRHIERESSNSGQPCPSLEELAGCMEYRSHQTEHCAPNTGPAFITTMEFGKGRIRHDVYGLPLDVGFCMEFRMESLTAQCGAEDRPHTRWMRYLREGHSVCVACQPPAMRNHSASCQGDGQESNSEELLHWQAVGNSQCRGTWKKVQRRSRCSCPQVHSFLFI
ncbi:somatomedin-B and thrombospondin type-1 domain-containing protein [Esox lucius]|uniref:SMB domain-containing protein n=1 Tax=Esox lucius TaxID=8010 RepID=A0AAY5K9A3_ESOLU|nr:somatomedin-B and thrombospondin type-1 domain-containing protein [Esox lucius]